MAENYEELLKRGRSKLPEKVFETTRFEPPKILGMIQGNKTIITNFVQIADYLRRDKQHMLKFFSNELATFTLPEGKKVILTGRFSSTKLNEKLQRYIQEFVLCPECKKPDTKIIKEGRISFIKCEACGTKKVIRTIK